MTQYNFAPQSVDTGAEWDDPSVWSGGIVPDSGDANVVIGPIVDISINQTLSYLIAINAGESFVENTVSLTSNYIELNGTLSVFGVFSLGAGGELDLNGGLLSAGSLVNDGVDIQGSGTIVTPTAFANPGTIIGDDLTLDVGALQNAGELLAQGEFNVNITSADASPFDGTLTGGTYGAEAGGTLVLELGAAITVDSATIQFGSSNNAENSGGSIASVDSSGDTLALQDTLRTIATNGTFSLFGGVFASAQAVTVDGSLVLADGGTFSAVNTMISATGTASVTGTFGGGNTATLSGAVIDNGVVSVVATAIGGGTLVVAGDVTGGGALLIGPAIFTQEFGDFEDNFYVTASNILDVQEACSVGVTFQSGAGKLVLDDPQGFSGTITPSAPEFSSISTGTVDANVVELTGISLASVTSYTYSGNAVGGALTITEGGVSQILNFAGDLDTQSFALSAGPQLLSSSPPSLDITITPQPASPTIGLQTTASTPLDAIVNTANPTVTGFLPAGATLFFYGGSALSVTDNAATPGLTQVEYTAEINTLGDGANMLFAAATNSVGNTSSQQPLSLFVLPDPVDGITTAEVDSLRISALQQAGYSMQFVAGTEAIQLTDGTLSVGPDTGDAYLQRLYEGLLGRNGDPAGLEANAAQLPVAGMAAIASDFLNSAEFQALHPTVASMTNGNFVVYLYQSFLGRAPDSAGFNAYVNALQSGVSRSAVAAAFADSAESRTYFQQDTSAVWVPSAAGGLITELFHTALDRVPDLGGLATFTDALQNGASMLQIAQAIVASPEFAADHAGQTATGLVTSFYEDGLGRQPDQGGLQTYLGELQSGASVSQVLLAIASSPEAGIHLLPSVS